MKYASDIIIALSTVGLAMFSQMATAKVTDVPMPQDPVIPNNTTLNLGVRHATNDNVYFGKDRSGPGYVYLSRPFPSNYVGKTIAITPEPVGMYIPGMNLPMGQYDGYLSFGNRGAYGLAGRFRVISSWDTRPYTISWYTGVLSGGQVVNRQLIFEQRPGYYPSGTFTGTLPAGGENPAVFIEVRGDAGETPLFTANVSVDEIHQPDRLQIFWLVAAARIEVRGTNENQRGYATMAASIRTTTLPKTTGMVMPETVDCGTGYVGVPLDCGAVSGWIKDGGTSASWLVDEISYTRTDTNKSARLWIDDVEVPPSGMGIIPWTNNSAKPVWQKLTLKNIKLQSDVVGINSAQVSLNVRYR